ncbi:MAG TPA: alkaline phosphatase family protein [Bacteroidia bacterium]|jgi:phospholipase C|nr:alkaline phosphatase family protein [Bacteroidia bacterium]
MKKNLFTPVLLVCIILASCNHKTVNYANGPDGAKIIKLREKIKHVIIIYQENWSFDGLFGFYPDKRVNNLLHPRGKILAQVSRKGLPLDTVPIPTIGEDDGEQGPDKRFSDLNKKHPDAVSYDLNEFVSAMADTVTGDIVHRYYTELLQVDGGKMDKFVAWSDNGGLVMSYYNDTTLPEERLAAKYTLCDNFFHSAFGGSFLNHQWFISAATPYWKNAPISKRSDIQSDKLKKYDNQYTPDGYAINTIYSVNQPHPKEVADSLLLPNITAPNIGDRLNDVGQTWAWYSGGWNAALKGDDQHGYFQYHHQPFVYYENYKDGSENKKKHLKDEVDFFAALHTDSLPAVSFIKPLGINNEHPGYANLLRGQKHVDSIVQQVMKSKYWENTVIIITYDEHGGRYDHVAPPKIDRWGPGSRVPTIVISPYAKKNYVDTTQYESVSVLKLLETMYDMPPLSKRDSAANGMLNAFDLQ